MRADACDLKHTTEKRSSTSWGNRVGWGGWIGINVYVCVCFLTAPPVGVVGVTRMGEQPAWKPLQVPFGLRNISLRDPLVLKRVEYG
ncbi:MAG: hypothetical protein D6788_02805 [Planctomycetota bacterium]|nr:MAG: hypothetical protein D6788_02805 [Planctomycetota bacterium]